MKREKLSAGILILAVASFLMFNTVNSRIIKGGSGASDYIEWELNTVVKEDSYEKFPWAEKNAPQDFYDKLEMEKMVSNIEEETISKSNIDPHPIIINVYEKSHPYILSKYANSASRAAKKTDFNGVIIYWTDYGVNARSFSPRLSYEKLEEIEDEALDISNEESMRKGVKHLLKEVSIKLSSEEGHECDPENPKDCGAAENINCNPTLNSPNSENACCPDSQRWNGDKCVNVKGQTCEDDSGCNKDYECSTINPQYEKICCPPDLIGVKTEGHEDSRCIKGTAGDKCERDSQCAKKWHTSFDPIHGDLYTGPDLYCNPTKEANYENACCPEDHQWDSSKDECIDMKGKECETGNCPLDMECNSVKPEDKISKMSEVSIPEGCCPEDKIWDGEKCVKGKNGHYCKRDIQCKGNKICNPVAYSESKHACCPRNKVWLPSKGKCVNEQGIPCEDKSKCPGDWECNRVNKEVEKGCCPPNKYWTGESCVAENGEGAKCSNSQGCKASALNTMASMVQVKDRLSCNPTSLDSNLEKACCPGSQVWNGEECLEAQVCENNDDCVREGWTCNSEDPKNIEKRCCPKDKIWNGEKCANAKAGGYCKRNSQCGLLRDCNPASDEANYESACCSPDEVYNGKKCVDALECNINDRCVREGYVCNSVDPDNVQKHCCPKDKVWNGEACAKSEKGEFCVRNVQCNPLSHEELVCTTYIGDYTKWACCPRYTMYDPEDGECKKAKRGDMCSNDLYCDTSKEDLDCNPTLKSIKISFDQEKHCCAGEQVFDTDKEECRYLDKGEACTNSVQCKGELYCYPTIEDSNKDKACCPSQDRWDGSSCVDLWKSW